MNTAMKSFFRASLKRAYEDLINGRCEVDDEQAMRILAVIAHRPISKDVACEEVLHWSRSKFDEYVAKELMPKGRKRRGWKELVWYEDEVLEAKDKLK